MNNRLKWYCLFVLIIIATFMSAGCGGKTGPMSGVEIYVSASADSESRSLYACPQNVKIAFTKLWFPSTDTFSALKSANPQYHEGQIFLTETDDCSDLDFYKPLTYTADEPYIFDASLTEPFKPTQYPGYNRTFHGVLMEKVYFELKMSDYSIRWYLRDSGSYKARDVLIDDGSGWKFAFIERTIKFDFHNSEQNPDEKVRNVDTTEIKIVTRDTREKKGTYFDNWYKSGSVTNDSGYIQAALKVYKNDEEKTLWEYYTSIKEPVGDDHDDQELIQYFRITRDVPNDAHPTFTHIGEDLVDGYWRETGGLTPCPELIAGYNEDSYENPNEIYTFPSEEENEAQLYKIGIYFDVIGENSETGCTGLGIDSDGDSLDADSAWSQIVSYVSTNDKFVSLSPITGGTETRFGWLDFDGVWQGEFSEDSFQ